MSTSPHPGTDASSWLLCNICQKQFSRPEHRRRHEEIHAREKQYKCNYCGKTFARKDSAKRHENSHETISSPEPASSVTLCGSCSACNRSHIKCSGGEPCTYCAAKNRVCTYENRKRKRTIYDQTEHAQNIIRPDEQSDGREDPSRATFLSTGGSASVASQISSTEAISPSRGDLPAEQSGPDPAPSISGLALAADSYEDRADMPNSFSQALSMGEMSTQEPDHRLLTLMETNWLPFDQSSAIDLAPSISDNHTAPRPSCSFHDSSLNIVDEDGLNANYHISIGEEDAFTRNDRVSALIASMRTGLPGLSSTSMESDRSTDDLEPIGPVNLYSDGAGARTSQSDRRILERQESHAIHEEILDHSGNSTPPWISILEAKLRKEQPRMHFSVPDDVYDEAYARVSREWSDARFSPALLLHKDTLLDKDTLEYFIQLYFGNFHTVNPFLDRSLLCIPVWGWSLYLVTAAIGARYICISEATLFGDSLCSLLHEVLFKELAFGHIEDSLPYIQARVLTAIGLCHSRQTSFMNCGYNAAALVFNSCLRLRLLDEDDRIGAFQPGQDVEQVWIAWRFRETRRRTGFFIYVTDCILAFMTQTPPRLQLWLLKLTVPCADDLWEADTCHKWFKHRGKTDDSSCTALDFIEEEQSRLQIQDVLRKLWTDLRPPRSLTDFGTATLIHILLRRVWDAAWYIDSQKDPWSQYQPHEIIVPGGYPAVIPKFSKWRNSTCDCLDVLHWEALGLSAKAGGLEGPVFLQLHLARLLLLTPVRQLFSHVQASRKFASNSLLPHNLYDVPEPDSECRQMIVTWAKKDRHKARLAVVHAGAIFWHVRRYSSDSFPQSFAVFLAAITLWAYGRFSQISIPPLHIGDETSPATVEGHEQLSPTATSQNPPGVSPSTSINSKSSPNATTTVRSSFPTGVTNRRRMPSFMQLDRPMDDELVQHFIRAGEGMTLFLEGVDDLCSDQGSEQVLREAILILNEAKDIWSISENYTACLRGVVGS